jgi:UDP-glucose 4-epimerase
MRLLVTGGAGYIGSVVVALLLDEGHEVTVIDDLSTGHRNAVPSGARFVQTSIIGARSVLREYRIEGVLHFAAKSVVAESVAQPEQYWRNNVAGTLELLDAMREEGVQRIIFSSSASTYGEPTKLPIPADAATSPTNPYGDTKLAVDLMLAAFARAHGLAATSLRYFNVAGAHGRYGERHLNETHLVPIALDAAAGERHSLEVYGTDYPTRDGSAIRDYLHVLDLAEAHLLALHHLRPSTHAIYNLGTGEGTTVLELIRAVREVTGRPVKVNYRDRRPGDPTELVADGHLAREELGWNPRRGLHDMVADAWTFREAKYF